MKSLRRSVAWVLSLAVGLVGLLNQSQAQPATKVAAGSELKLQPVAPDKAPKSASFWSLQRLNFPPLPFNPFPELPLYSLKGTSNSYVYDDAAIDYEAIYKKQAEAQALRQFDWELGLLSNAEFFSLESSGISTASYSSSDLWIELLKVENDYAYLTLHGTLEGENYQLRCKTNLAQAGPWKLGEIITGAPSTNQTDFSPLYVLGDTNQFFLAHHANPIVSVSAGSAAYESNALITTSQAGYFYIYCNYSNAVVVYYQMSGTASNGVDYTNLTGTVTIPANAGSVTLEVQPKPDSLIEGGESVVLTLLQTNTYLIQPGSVSASLNIWDASTTVQFARYFDAVETNGPPGIASAVGSFYFQRWDDLGYLPPMAVHYVVSGTASNGVDYTALSGMLTFAQDENFKTLEVNPVDDSLVEGPETVTLTLTPTNFYLIQPGSESDTITNADSSTTVEITLISHATEPHPANNTPKQTGRFTVTRADTRGETFDPLTINYAVSGTAANGVDYTNLTGSVTFQATEITTNIFIEPLYDDVLEGDETVTVTLLPNSDNYLISSVFPAATLQLKDNNSTNLFRAVASLTSPVGIDYHAPSNSLIVSCNQNFGGTTYNFARLYTNTVASNLVTSLTNWSSVRNVPDEIKLLTIKATAAGFTNGDTYFGSGNNIGWLSADGTRSNLTWCVLTNAAQTNALPIRGGLCQDETGFFNYDLIAVTSSGGVASVPKGVWRINAQGQPTLLANIDTAHLEGVIVLSNNPTKWGPWAGKVVTGDEQQSLIYTIAANGTVTSYDTTLIHPEGIHTEDFEIVPANQDLYGCDYPQNVVVKLSRTSLTNWVGELLIVDAGEVTAPGRLFMVRWNAATTNFQAAKIPYYRSNGSLGLFEHVTFAPTSLPPLNP